MIEDALRALLIAPGSATEAIIGSRVYPLRLPQEGDNQLSPMPAVTYRVVSAPRVYSHAGQSALLLARIQLDLHAEAYGDAQRLRTAIVGTRTVPGVLSGRKAVVELEGVEHEVHIRRIFVTMERDMGESDDGSAASSPFGKSLDLEVWFWET